jgi:hypothetical protein
MTFWKANQLPPRCVLLCCRGMAIPGSFWHTRIPRKGKDSDWFTLRIRSGCAASSLNVLATCRDVSSWFDWSVRRPGLRGPSLMIGLSGGEVLSLIYFVLALHEMKKAKNPRIAILIISDGGDNHSRYTAAEIHAMVREADIRTPTSQQTPWRGDRSGYW